VESALIDPGKPWQNGTTESFNGKLRDKCLSMEWFRNPIEARIAIEDWKQHYHEVRPHSCLGYMTPFEAAQLKQINLNSEAKFQVARREKLRQVSAVKQGHPSSSRRHSLSTVTHKVNNHFIVIQNAPYWTALAFPRHRLQSGRICNALVRGYVTAIAYV
jgi:hypothetical protein